MSQKLAQKCETPPEILEAKMEMSALFTDFYELTMAQGLWKHKKNDAAVFDMFFRRNPFGGSYSVFCGSETFFELLRDFRFSQDDLDFLAATKMFEKGFLDFLRDFKFSGDIYAIDEGSIVFPNEPLMRVHANLIEAQIIEGFLLNTVNFQSLIATKTSRVWLASKRGSIMEFGLRRAQGFDGAMSATRAAYVGGASSTSNTLAGKIFGIPLQGTIAHSWVMSFDSEKEAFDAYADCYPDKSVFLIDTYNTLGSGIDNAIKAGKRLQEKGFNFGVRLDSGDIQYLAKEVRKKLDDADCKNAKIVVSNELDEHIIDSLIASNTPIDSWGVGTHLVTGGNEASFTGVYKLASRLNKNGNQIPEMKISDNPAKTTNPGIKNVFRIFNADGTAKADILALDSEKIEAGENYTFFHPAMDYRSFNFACSKVEPLLKKRFENGKYVGEQKSQNEIIKKSRAKFESEIPCFDETYRRLLNPHEYKVSLTKNLRDLKEKFVANYAT